MKKKLLCFILLFINSFLLFMYLSDQTQFYSVIKSEDIDKIVSSEKETYVYFFSKDCTACSQMKKTLEKVVLEEKIQLYGIDVKESYEETDKIITEHNISKTPTLIKYNNGVEKSRNEGYSDYNKLKNFFE